MSTPTRIIENPIRIHPIEKRARNLLGWGVGVLLRSGRPTVVTSLSANARDLG
jgi:hypothetical protein